MIIKLPDFLIIVVLIHNTFFLNRINMPLKQKSLRNRHSCTYFKLPLCFGEYGWTEEQSDLADINRLFISKNIND